ncbi:zinc finger protein 79-like [Amia ocellicauda]|uniref:zinc finger protein 79-like n=1 Tax=Amia ocellicauda TaxID=2972642 RepID=UPI0034640D64
MSVSAALSGRLSSALAELMRAALCEIWKAVEETVSESRVEITRRQRENEALRRRLQELMVAGEAAVCHWSSGADGPPVQSRGAGRREGETRAAADGAVEASALPDSGERAPIEQQHCEQEWSSSLRQDTEPTDTEDNQGLTEQHKSRQSEKELKVEGLEFDHSTEPQAEGFTQGLGALGSECGQSREQCEPLLVSHYIKTEDDTLESEVYKMEPSMQTPFTYTLGNIKPENIIETVCNPELVLPVDGLSKLEPELSELESEPCVDGQCDPQSAALRKELSGGSDSTETVQSSSSQYRQLCPRPSTSHTPPSERAQKHQGCHSCPQCGKRYSKLSSLKKHQDNTQHNTLEKPYCCSHCGKRFSQARYLHTHQAVHKRDQTYSCSQCGKGFSQARYLQAHQKIHTRKKTYCCSQCGKSFHQPAHLRIHQLSHTGGKPCPCSQCGKGFTRLAPLESHQFIHTGNKPDSCSQSGESFGYAKSLQSPQQIHTGEGPCCCSQCGKSFGRLDSLKTHQWVHTGYKLYCCSQCGKEFTRANNLKRHQQVHMRKRVLNKDKQVEGEPRNISQHK